MIFSRSTHELGEQWIQRVLQKQLIPGFLGRNDGGGTYTFAVPGKSGYTYCRLWNGEITTLDICVNSRAPLEPNNMVWLKRVSGVLTVDSSDPLTAANLFGGNVGAAGIAPHIDPNDTSLVTGTRIADLLVHAPDPAFAGLNACVEAGETPYGYLIRRSDYDVSAYLPSTAGMRWWVGCYVDTDGTVKFTTNGAVETDTAAAQMVLDNGGSSAVAALENIVFPAGAFPLAGIVLETGQTVVDVNTRFQDWRIHFASVGALLAGDSEARTIASGVIVTGNKSIIVVTPESGTTDTLDTITLTGAKRELWLIASAGATITIATGSGLTQAGTFTENAPAHLYHNGTTGYVLSTGGGGGASPLTTKGDLFGYDTADARIPVGTNGQILTADNTQALGVKWGTGAPGSLTQAYLGYNAVGGSNEIMTAGKVYMKKITLAAAGFLADIEAYIDHSATTNVQSLVMYLMDDNAGVPDKIIQIAPYLLTNTYYPNTPGRWVGMPISRWLAAGDYWIAAMRPTSSGTNLRIYYDTSGSDRTMTTASSSSLFWIADGSLYTQTNSTNKYSMRANLLT